MIVLLLSMKTFRKITEKGQVTLPALWRKHAKTNLVSIVEKNGVLEVRPAKIVDDEEILFSADRDNNGKGIPIRDILKAHERMRSKK